MRLIRSRAVALTVAVMLLALSLGAGTALADGGRHHGDAQNTFTKWVSAYPIMAGVDGGAVGTGPSPVRSSSTPWHHHDAEGDRGALPLQWLATFLHRARPRRADGTQGRDQWRGYRRLAEGQPGGGEVHADHVYPGPERHLLPGHARHPARVRRLTVPARPCGRAPRGAGPQGPYRARKGNHLAPAASLTDPHRRSRRGSPPRVEGDRRCPGHPGASRPRPRPPGRTHRRPGRASRPRSGGRTGGR